MTRPCRGEIGQGELWGGRERKGEIKPPRLCPTRTCGCVDLEPFHLSRDEAAEQREEKQPHQAADLHSQEQLHRFRGQCRARCPWVVTILSSSQPRATLTVILAKNRQKCPYCTEETSTAKQPSPLPPKEQNGVGSANLHCPRA